MQSAFNPQDLWVLLPSLRLTRGKKKKKKAENLENLETEFRDCYVHIWTESWLNQDNRMQGHSKHWCFPDTEFDAGHTICPQNSPVLLLLLKNALQELWRAVITATSVMLYISQACPRPHQGKQYFWPCLLKHSWQHYSQCSIRCESVLQTVRSMVSRSATFIVRNKTHAGRDCDKTTGPGKIPLTVCS